MTRSRLLPLLIMIAAFAHSLPAQEQASVVLPSQTEDALYRVTGRVVDDLTGAALSGVVVTLQTVVLRLNCSDCDPPPQPYPEAEPPRKTVTGSDGRFTFGNVPAKDIYVSASKDGYDAPSRRHIDDPLGIYLVNSQTAPIVLRLEPLASISGVLRNHAGKPITKNATIELRHLADWAGWPRLEYAGFAEFDADGTYHLRGLHPGRYFLVADPSVNEQGPEHNAKGQAVGEVPVRYPASNNQSSAFFPVREGENLHIDLRFPQKTLHRVTGSVEEDQPYSYSIVDTNESGAYLLKRSLFEKPFEVWLPKGSFRLSTGRDDVTGPLPFEVADSDLSDLSFSIAPPDRIEIPVEVSSVAPPASICSASESVCGYVNVALVRLLYGGYVEVVSEAGQFGKFDSASPQSLGKVSLVPGNYQVAIAPSLNVYAKSVVCGPTNFAVEPLTVHVGDAPDPIRVILAEGAIVDGVVLLEGKLARAWVYAVAQDIGPKVDFREFVPVTSDRDGKFHFQGLAPGDYLFFASEVEVPLNVHDSAAVDYWRPRGKIIHVEAGRSTALQLSVAQAPEVP